MVVRQHLRVDAPNASSLTTITICPSSLFLPLPPLVFSIWRHCRLVPSVPSSISQRLQPVDPGELEVTWLIYRLPERCEADVCRRRLRQGGSGLWERSSPTPFAAGVKVPPVIFHEMKRERNAKERTVREFFLGGIKCLFSDVLDFNHRLFCAKSHICVINNKKTEGPTNLKVLDAVCSFQLTQTVALFSTYFGLFNVTVSDFRISV